MNRSLVAALLLTPVVWAQACAHTDENQDNDQDIRTVLSSTEGSKLAEDLDSTSSTSSTSSTTTIGDDTSSIAVVGELCPPPEPLEDDLTLGNVVEFIGPPNEGQVTALKPLTDGVAVCGSGFVQVVSPFDGAAGDPFTPVNGCVSIESYEGADDLDYVIVFSGGGDYQTLRTSEAGLFEEVAAGEVTVGELNLAVTATTSVITDGEGTVFVLSEGSVFSMPLLSTGSLGEPVHVGDDATALGIGEGELLVGGRGYLASLDPTTGAQLGRLELEGEVTHIAVNQNNAIVARGGFGWTLVHIGEAGALENRFERVTWSPTLSASFVADTTVLTVEGSRLNRFELLGDTAPFARHLSTEERPARGQMTGDWFRTSTTTSTGQAVVTLGNNVVAVELAETMPKPELYTRSTFFGLEAEGEESKDALFLLHNEGGADLVIGDVSVTDPFEFVDVGSDLALVEGCRNQRILPPGSSALVELLYSPNAGTTEKPHLETQAEIASNDPDFSQLAMQIELNRPGLVIGDDAPDFELQTLRGERFRMSEQEGKVVLLTLFNSSCTRCTEDIPAIESTFVQQYSREDLEVVSVNVNRDCLFAEQLVFNNKLEMLIPLDVDGQVFRHYREPGLVFPLHLVVDQTGKIVHSNTLDGEEMISAAKTAVDEALDG